MEEFVPLKHIYSYKKFIWIIVLFSLLGGFAGYLISTARAPVYEATASFFVMLDMEKVNQLPFTLADEDIAMTAPESALMLPDVLSSVVDEANQQNIQINLNTLLDNKTIERSLERWDLRYRSTSPVIAQNIANLWANKGY